ncbi:hypothetical protein SAMN05444004_101459 [Jannaschia faecimaris]|uniref:Uncharacterized protein n=1 Tax=Jannaschia faecimaris TaxID=1244108 RepID=A0A1H3JY07_9RHOB|nr:hypothetical protein [Jannaschia faecimaris]SDY44509.1 hypothetical protein SAMN05444004_101459 [Jannaschia faecimaris]
MNRDAQLDLLRQLSRLRADRAAARLARIQGLLNTLEDKATALREEPDTPFTSVAESVVRDRWNRWRAVNLMQINTQVARLNIAAQPQREAQARDIARAAVLTKLRTKR